MRGRLERKHAIQVKRRGHSEVLVEDRVPRSLDREFFGIISKISMLSKQQTREILLFCVLLDSESDGSEVNVARSLFIRHHFQVQDVLI